MDTIKKYAKMYELQLLTGTSAVGLGYLSKKLMKREIISVNDLKNVGESFVLVSLAGVVAQEIYKRNQG